MKKRLLLLLFVGQLFLAHANKIDTTIFDSPFEKEIFLEYIKDSTSISPLQIFLAIDGKKRIGEVVRKFDKLTSRLIEMRLKDATKKSQFKKIYNTVHSQLLSKYDSKKHFVDIFIDGTYNCVTASALYALILDKLNVKYVVKETPTHVYLIAGSGNHTFMFETTFPSQGVFSFDEKFKRRFLNYLLENKIVSQSELSTQDHDKLFDKHFFTDKTIDIIKLASLQYYNEGLYAVLEKDYKTALKNLEKANILYNSHSIKYMLNATFLNVLDEKEDYYCRGKTLAKFLNINHESAKASYSSVNYFKNVSNKLALKNPDLEKYDSYFNGFKEFINDSINIDEIKHEYHFYCAYYYYSNYDFQKSLMHLKKSYELNPNNVHVKNLIRDVVINELSENSLYGADIETIEEYLNEFPFLKKHKNLQNYVAYSYAKKIDESFDKKDNKKGMRMVEEFEHFLHNLSDRDFGNDYIANVYATVSSYYVRKGEYEEAVAYLRKGLEFVPDSYELKRRIKNIKEYQGKPYDYKVEDNLSIKEYKKNVQLKLDIINENIKEYLVNCWTIVKLSGERSEIPVPRDAGMHFTFLSDNKVTFTYNGEKDESATWQYDPTKAILTIDSNNDHRMSFLILDINKYQLKIMPEISGDDFPEGASLVFKRCLK